MTNNELEARVIELETQLACKEQGTNEACLDLQEALEKLEHEQERHAALEEEIKAVAAARPAIPFAEWYYTVHPKLGGNQDLQALLASAHDRIIA